MRWVVLGGIALTVVLAPAEAHAATCWPAHSHTIVATRDGRVYQPPHGTSYVACSYRFRRHVKLDLPYGDEAHAPYVLNRRYVFYGTSYCEGASPGCYYDVVERDLRTGRVRFDLTNANDSPSCDTDYADCGKPVAKHVLLRADGATAWLACEGNFEEPPYESECTSRRHSIEIADGHGARIVDTGRIAARSLHFSADHRRAIWTKGGKRRSARLYFSAAGQTIR
jgi:hypothetical protein